MARAVTTGRKDTAGTPWWADAVCYEIFVRSFADFDGDGVGDLEGIRERLGYLDLLGADAVRLSPFYLSPLADNGYDIAGPRAVDPVLGNLDTVASLVTEAHRHDIRVIVDVVPNHTSDRHSWFADALAAARGGPERDRYHFRDGSGPGGTRPPNTWLSATGEPAWTRVQDGQWYLHRLGAGLPDLNWANPEVAADFEHTLRFWLDLGIDGVRVSAAHAMTGPAEVGEGETGTEPFFDGERVHEVHQLVRKVLDEYPHAVAIGEVPLADPRRFARYLRAGELQLAVEYRLANTPFDADAIQATIERTLATATSAGAPAVWACSGHDLHRLAARFGGGQRGTRRARAMAIVVLGLPGLACVFNGDELGLGSSPSDDPRIPVPWEGNEPPFGFSARQDPWLPIPGSWAPLTVEAQLEDAGSTLSLYRRALELRGTHAAFAGTAVRWYGAPPGCFAYRRDPGGLVCALNTSAAPVPVPPGEVLLSSAPLVEGKLPAEAACWLGPVS
ncbi:alpha-amylase family glycosyl hydrolase [Prauserella marina]|uniref:alpha-amylase family glycosyl hydrolase n=1 Tax=Prauserella marina TaxID=530584 RepID=UPI001FE34771|nr:alpha-amylase family glycosyl hydrolase [Prauserella marina]